MVRIAGVEIPDQKRAEIGLTYIFGIGRSNVRQLLKKAEVLGDKIVKDLTGEEISKIQKALENFNIEGDLRQEISSNIKRLEDIGAYRGVRHKRGLPVRGQRTRSNARTRRGKRKTMGALRKDIAAKMDKLKPKGS